MQRKDKRIKEEWVGGLQFPTLSTQSDIEEQDKVVQDLIEEVAGHEDNLTARFENDILEEKREGRGRQCY